MRDTNKRVRVTSALCLLFSFSAPVLAGDLPCPGNLDGDAFVGPFDLALLLGSWGLCADPCKPGDPENTCAADLNGDCVVGAFDLASLLGAWGPCPGPPVNDVCEGAIEIFDGDTDFDTTDATTGPPTTHNCNNITQPRFDLWYDYTATCTGLLKVCTCGFQIAWDTVLAMYEDTQCPVTPDRQLQCNDDGLACFPGLTSRLAVIVAEGESYKIRVGGLSAFPGGEDRGPGSLAVVCLEGQVSDCCVAHDGGGCDDSACEDFICFIDPFCCDEKNDGFWDETCALEAVEICSVCEGGC